MMARALVVLAAFAAAGIGPSTATAATIDFQSLEIIGFGNTSAGTTYAEDGFVLTAIGGDPPHFQFYETMNPRYPGSTALFFGLPETSARLTNASGLPFSVASIDLALNLAGGGFVAFTGYLVGGGTVFQEFVVPTEDLELVTFNFSGFENLERLEWDEEFHLAHQFDNIAVQIVPEPSTAFLLVAGLLVMSHRRRPRWPSKPLGRV